MKLPPGFLNKNNNNVRGGIEWAFMSTTTDEAVAKFYARGSHDTSSTLIDAEMGMVDRGADIAWLSQYPEEREILFPPLTAIEVLETQAEQTDGQEVLRVKVRLNVCPYTQKIEDLLGVRKKQMVEL